MTEPSSKPFDLQDRTLEFAKQVRCFVKAIAHTLSNVEDARQLVRASGSVGANYIEANDSLGKKDFVMRIKICRKEAKECRYWLSLIDVQGVDELCVHRDSLIQEASELVSIFSAIARKSE
jgi:four helix bundle protein